jgi:hypothetical protein
MIELILCFWLFWISSRIGNIFLTFFGMSKYNKAETVLFSIGLGLGCLSFLIWGLGQTNLLYATLVYFILILSTVFNLLSKKQNRVSVLKENFPFNIITISLLLVLTIVGMVNILGALTPELRHDSLQYHLSVPHYYILHHQMLDIPYLIYHFYSLNMEMLYTLALLLDGGALAKLIHAGMAILSAYGIYLLSKRYFPSPIPLLAAALFYSLPQVAWMSSTTFNENGWMFFGVLSVMAWLLWWDTQDKRWLYLTGIYCGLGMTIKLIVIVFYPFLLILATIYIIARKKTWSKMYQIIITGLLMIVPVIPWLVRNYIYTANPVFPLLSNVFRSYPEYIYAGNSFHNIRQLPPLTLSILFERMCNAFTSIQINGNGMLPLFFISILVILLFWKSVSKEIKFLMFYGVAAWCIYNVIEGGLDGRFLYPSYPFMAIVSAYIIWFLLQRIPHLSKIVIAIICVAMLLTFGYGRYGFYQDFHESPLPILGSELQSKYLSSHLQLYPAYQFVNDNLPKDATLILSQGYGALYCNRKYMAGSEFDRSPLMVILEHSKTPEDMNQLLNEWHVTYLVLPSYWTEAKRSNETGSAFVRKYSTILFQDAHFIVVKINPTSS